MSSKRKSVNSNALKNAITGLYLSGNKNVYKLTSPNGTKSVLVNKNSLLSWVASETIRTINNLNRLVGRPYVPEQLRGNLGRAPVRNPVYGVPLNFKNVSRVRLTNQNLTTLANLVKQNEMEAARARNQHARRARTLAQGMARGRRAQERQERRNAARTFYKISWWRNTNNGTMYGNNWVNKNGREINGPTGNYTLQNNNYRNNNMRNRYEDNSGNRVSRIRTYRTGH